MFDWIIGIITGVTGRISEGVSSLRLPLPSLPRGVVFDIFRPQDPADDPQGATLQEILDERQFRSVPETLPSDGIIQTGITTEGEEFIPDDIGPADFEPDLGSIDRPAGTAQEVEETASIMALGIIPIVGAVAGAAARGIGAGAAFATGLEIFDQFTGALLGTTDAGGTSTAVPEPSTTVGTAGSGVEGGNGTGPARGACCPGGGPTIAKTRAGILKGIGAQHGRCSFSYNVARRILRDLGEEAGARCLGITAGAACFLLIHPPKRRGRQITPKQINRAMGAYKRVKALNKSVRKTLGPGCKL